VTARGKYALILAGVGFQVIMGELAGGEAVAFVFIQDKLDAPGLPHTTSIKISGCRAAIRNNTFAGPESHVCNA
jgi:hypothetical protein